MIHILDIAITAFCEAIIKLAQAGNSLYKSATIIISTNDTLSWIFIQCSASSLACLPQGPIILIPSQPAFALSP